MVLNWQRIGMANPVRQPHCFPAILKLQIVRKHLQPKCQLHNIATRIYLSSNSISFLKYNHPYTCPLPPRTHYLTSSLAASQDSNPSPNQTVGAVIKGRVQGVFYRNWTVENATELGLRGWVRNRRDGSVEALFSGPPEKVQEMEQRCRRGPSDAMVTRFDVFPSDEDPGTGFQRRQTLC